MKVLKSLTYCSILLGFFCTTHAKAALTNENAVEVEIQKCLIPVARSIFEQVYRIPYKDEYDASVVLQKRHSTFSNRNCSVTMSPECVHFETTEITNPDWRFYNYIPNTNPAKIDWIDMDVSINEWTANLEVLVALKSDPKTIRLTTREIFPTLRKVSKFDLAGYDLFGREILTSPEPPKYEFNEDHSTPPSEAAVLYNDNVGTQIRVNLRSYGECLRNISR